jgi:hypothetical protein
MPTRAGALFLSRSQSRLVSRNGARWLRAKVRSSPSAVRCRIFQRPPALLISTSIRGRRWRTWSASRRTCDWSDRSATNTSVCPLAAASISRAAPSVDTRSWPQIARRPHLGRAQGGRLADPAAAPGDQHRLGGHRPVVEPVHGRAPRTMLGWHRWLGVLGVRIDVGSRFGFPVGGGSVGLEGGGGGVDEDVLVGGVGQVDRGLGDQGTPDCSQGRLGS